MPRERSGLPPLRSGMGAGPLIEAAGLAEVTAPQGAPRGKWEQSTRACPHPSVTTRNWREVPNPLALPALLALDFVLP